MFPIILELSISWIIYYFVIESRAGGKGSRGRRKPYQFEAADPNLSVTYDPDQDESLMESNVRPDVRAGRVEFGGGGGGGSDEVALANLDASFPGLDARSLLLKHLELGQGALFSAWKLAVSYGDPWSADVEGVAKLTAHNLSKLFSIVLDCPAVEFILPQLNPQSGGPVTNPRLFYVISTYR
jgi:hypothetical protein